MKRIMLLSAVTALLNACIPLQIPPKIENYKIAKGKQFKRGLPKKTLFVFQDPKAAGHFYDYVNTKFNLQDYYVDVQVPFHIDDASYFFSFYEVEKKEKTLNLIPVLFDATLNIALGNEDMETYTASDENTLYRAQHWYIAIEVFSATEKDCLHENFSQRAHVLAYLQDLKNEYLSTQNYNEIVFKD